MLLAGVAFSRLPDFTVDGIVLGGVYAMAALGLVLIYRVSGVLNFAHGAVAMFSAFVAYQCSIKWGWPSFVGLIAAIITGMALGLAIEVLTMRPLAGRSALTKVVVTIGWLLVLQTLAGIIWGDNAYHRPVELVSRNGFRLWPLDLRVGYDQLATLAVAGILAGGTAWLLRATTLGVSLRAVADDPGSARLWGISVNRVTAASWMAGSAMAAVAGVLVTPLINFTPFSLTVIVIDAFTAALIGGLVSLPMTVLGAMLLGLAQSYPDAFTSNSGAPALFTFVLVIGVLVVRYRPRTGRTRVA